MFSLCPAAGTVLWDGNFNNYSVPTDFDKWSWANQTGQYQWYIHGTAATSNYLLPGTTYKNPADTKDLRGIKLSIDNTSSWNGQTMARTEIIPQTTQNLGTGKQFYHFSISNPGTNPPLSTIEHQIFFFESHFTELKYGVSPNATALQWFVAGNAKYSVPFTAGVWYNFAYEIDFSGAKVGLWASTGASDLVQVVAPVSASPSTNSADFHIGVLRLAVNAAREDYAVSGVYVESGTINTKIATW
ncbi:hypothetical protein DL96DRAFT_1670497 [Flagelloscypha sp. PMI_526]|nr:hypothetical protein DL96DRAFT_1670497 [Flagelloscypha sp. PMI_526]